MIDTKYGTCDTKPLDYLAHDTAQNQPERTSVWFYVNAANRELALNG